MPRELMSELIFVGIMFLSLAGCGRNHATVIEHTVFIFKENRTTDSVFGTFPGVDGATTGVTSSGKVVPLSHMPDDFEGQGMCNNWECAIEATDGGKMDRFDIISGGSLIAYSQLHANDIPNYWA